MNFWRASNPHPKVGRGIVLFNVRNLLACASGTSLAFGTARQQLWLRMLLHRPLQQRQLAPPLCLSRTARRSNRRHRSEARRKRPGRTDFDRCLSSATLEKNNVTRSRGWQVTPNFNAAKGAQTSYIRMSVRGIGAASNTTVEPSVAVFWMAPTSRAQALSSVRCWTSKVSKFARPARHLVRA